MKYTVTITPRAEDDRQLAYRWFSENYSSEFANQWWHGVTAAMHSLADMPGRCHKALESGDLPFDVYELLHGKRHNKHRVLFRIEKSEVVILHVRHSSRRDVKLEDLE